MMTPNRKLFRVKSLSVCIGVCLMLRIFLVQNGTFKISMHSTLIATNFKTILSLTQFILNNFSISGRLQSGPFRVGWGNERKYCCCITGRKVRFLFGGRQYNAHPHPAHSRYSAPKKARKQRTSWRPYKRGVDPRHLRKWF